MTDDSSSSVKSEDEHEKQQWFHGMLAREDINKLLTEDGQFLCRLTEPEPGMGMRTVLSARWNGKNHHFVINEDSGKVFIEKMRFPNVFELIRYHRREKKPITEATGAILKTPIPQQNWELRHESITLGKLIGEGAFGGVYAGELVVGTRTYKVAVKVSKCQMVTKKIITEICKEARIMRRYRHRNVVKFYGVAVDREPVMLVMEMADGGALDIILQKKKADLTTADRTRFAFGAACGLEYLHSNDCIHRDVAARNCLVHRGEVKLSDFGLSRELSNRAKKYTLKDLNQRLPIRWLAPEVLSSATYSKKSDVYSYGILLWEIFSNGAIPYPDLTLAEVSAQVQSGYRLSPPDSMPTCVARIMTYSCFPANPENRSKMIEIRKQLREFMDQLSFSTRSLP